MSQPNFFTFNASKPNFEEWKPPSVRDHRLMDTDQYASQRAKMEKGLSTEDGSPTDTSSTVEDATLGILGLGICASPEPLKPIERKDDFHPIDLSQTRQTDELGRHMPQKDKLSSAPVDAVPSQRNHALFDTLLLRGSKKGTAVDYGSSRDIVSIPISSLNNSSESDPQAAKHHSATASHASSPSMLIESTTTSSLEVESDEPETSNDVRRVNRDRLLGKLMSNFKEVYFARLASTFKDRNISSHQGGSQSPVSSDKPQNGTHADAPTGHEGKRKISGTKQDDTEEDGAMERRKRSKGPNEDQSLGPVKRLACPFFKRRPHVYITKKSCPGPGWQDVHRLKEHLYRCHMRPLDCNRCGACFDSAALLRDHQRAEVPCQTRDYIMPEGVTNDQKNELRSRKKTTPDLTEFEKWKKMYRILFPDDDPNAMPSPYYEIPEDAQASQPLSAGGIYEDFLRYDLPAHVRHQFALEIERQMGPIEDRIRLLLPDIVHRAHRLFWTSASTTQANHSTENSSSEPGERRVDTPPSENSPDAVEAPSARHHVHLQHASTGNTLQDSENLLDPASYPTSSQLAIDGAWPQYDFSSIIDEMQFGLQNEDDSDPWITFNNPFPFP